MEVKEETQKILQNCVVEGLVVKLPPDRLDPKIYKDVAKNLELIGGKWNRKSNGFLFNEDPTNLLSHVASGEKKDIKKEFQFFPTPDDIADYLVELSEVEYWHDILEPSAGQGAIVNAIHRTLYDSFTVWAFELMPLNQTFLNKIIGCRLLGSDFLTECETSFDRIIANPPFNKNQDIDHVYKMYQSLKDNGRLVSVASKHWQLSTNKKETEFRNWLKSVDAEIIEIESGRFKSSGTMVATCIIVINK